MDSLKKVSTQTLWQLLGKAFSALTGLFILSLVTRTYGESGTGLFTLTLAYLAFFGVVVEFGMNAHLLPEILNNKEGVFQKLLGLRLWFSVLLSVVALIIAPLLPIKAPGFTTAVLFGLLIILGSGLFDTISLVFQSRQRFDLTILASCIGIGVGTIFAYWLIVNHIPAYNLLLSESLGWMIALVMGFILVKRYSPISFQVDLSFVKESFKASWPIATTLILSLVYFRLDAFLLQYYKGLSETGIYNLSYQLFQAALVLPTFIMNSYYPLMLNLVNQRAAFLYQLKRALGIMLGLSLLGTVFTWLLSPILIQIITSGKGFTGSVVSLQLLSLGFPAYFLTSVLMWVLVSLKKYKPMLLVYIIGLLTNALLNLLFIPHYSYLAASLSTGASEYLILVLQIIILFKYL